MIYDGALYKCNTDISTAEDFDSTKWDATTIDAELSELNSSNVKLRRVITRFPASASDILTNGYYWYINIDSGIPAGEHSIIGIFVVTTKWNLPMFIQRNPSNIGNNYALRVNASKTDFPNVSDLVNSELTIDISYTGPKIV